MGRVVGERYRLTGLIGQGGMGVVYEAEHLAIRRLVAVKVLLPQNAQDRSAISRMKHEARVAGTLGHPNICAIYDMGRLEDGSPYLVMERLKGETLAQRVARQGRLGSADLVDVVSQVLSALAAAHQRGVIHRDLKPENIFLAGREGMRPVPKLLDFGISKAEDVEDTVAGPNGALMAVGTPYYMAPEQARGDRLDYRVDIWATGVVLYEGLTGERPFQAKNYNALLVQILSAKHRSVRELDPRIPAELARIVDKALAKRPDDRFQSALDMQSALRSCQPSAAGAAKLPVIFDEATSDDTDATTVFARADFRRPKGQATGPAVPSEELAPPGPPRVAVDSEMLGGDFSAITEDLIDDERTMVEDPPFLNDTLTMIQTEHPGKKK